MADDQGKKDYLSNFYTELYGKDIVELNGIFHCNLIDFLLERVELF